MPKKKKSNTVTNEQKDFIKEAEDKLNKSTNEPKESKAPEDVADEDGLCDVGATKKIPMEQLLQIKISHLEGDIINNDIKACNFEVQAIDRSKVIANLKLSDLKAQLTRKSRGHKELIEDISRKAGVNLRNSTINYETGEVNFV
jgi:hypothetical protein